MNNLQDLPDFGNKEWSNCKELKEYKDKHGE